MTATSNLRDKREELAFPNNQEAENLLLEYVQRLVAQKQKTRSWGTSTIEIAWKDGQAEAATIHEKTTHKFGQRVS